MIEALMDFLKHHPDIAPRCTIKNLWYGPGLQIAEKAFIKAVAPRGSRISVGLRLEKFIEDEIGVPEKEAVVCEDISQL
jgi:hypothetical protein